MFQVPRNRYWGLHPPPVPLEQVIDDGLMAIQRAMFLKKAGVDTAADEVFLLNPPSKADLLELAIKNIIRYFIMNTSGSPLYLCVSRDWDLNPPVKEGVDTLLMYLYRALNLVADMEKLASSQNYCIVEELETLLDDSRHLRTLAFLYASKGMYSKALTIWRMLAKNYSTGLWKNPASSVAYDSPKSCTDLSSGQQNAANEASKLLQESSDQDLVMEHLEWVCYIRDCADLLIADIDQNLAIQVLTSEKRTNQLSPVTMFAEKVLSSVDPRKVEIHQRRGIASFLREETPDSTVPAGSGRSAYQYPVRLVRAVHTARTRRYSSKWKTFCLWQAILYRKMGQERMVLQILAM
ncbi:hypothetical protein BHE74_00007317 [Ensete ventricosum]|nr:hypothetical protein BHE74_00007317 [Ensete ventricosum]